MMENLTHFFDMTAWQKMYFIGMWFGMSWFILEMQKITKDMIAKIPEIKNTIKREIRNQIIEINKMRGEKE